MLHFVAQFAGGRKHPVSQLHHSLTILYSIVTDQEGRIMPAATRKAISLLPDNPGAWTYRAFEDLYAIGREEREELQLQAVRIHFERMRNRIPALKKLAD